MLTNSQERSGGSLGDDLPPEKKPGRRVNGSLRRVVISGLILTAFWGALLYDYWPDVLRAVLRIAGSARAVGAQSMDSRYFEVRNTSQASEEQVWRMLTELEKQYEAITGYVQLQRDGKIPVLLVNGEGPTLTDGEQIILYYDDGQIDTALAPFFMVLMIEELPVDPQSGIVPAGGHSLQVMDAAGLAENLVRQPLDDWVVLLRQENGYLPLEEAWELGIPTDEERTYDLFRALLESGSFMRWYTEKYGLDSARRLASGDRITSLTGKPLAENEEAWLRGLEAQGIQPKACEEVIPGSSIFRLLCRNLQKTNP